jgi:restriction endonuclease Mrr
MTALPTPTYDHFLQPTLDALHALDGQATNVQIYEWVVKRLTLPDKVVQRLHKPNGSLTEIQYRMMWARTYLRQVGLIDSPVRSTWVLTELGQQTRQIDPAAIVKAVKQLHVPRSQTEETATETLSSIATADELQLLEESSFSAPVSLTPDYPRYDQVRLFLQIVRAFGK